MNDLLTDSFVGGAAQDAPSVDHGAEDEKLRAFLAEAEAAQADMAALRDELSRLQSAHEASKSLLLPRGPAAAAATQAALLRLLGSARRLRARLASMDRRAPPPAAHAAAGLRDRLRGLTAGVQALRRQVSADRRADAARRYLVSGAGEAPTEDQLDRLLAVSGAGGGATDEAMLSSSEEELVEGGLLELQELFLDMAALVGAQGPRLGDIERHVAAAAQDAGAAEAELREARRLRGAAGRRKMWLAAGLAAGLAAALLAALAVAAVVVALALARRRGGGNNVRLPGARVSGLLDLPL